LNPRFLLDTHIVVRWLATPKKLSREQTRVLREAIRRREPVAVSAITLLEIAVLFGKGSARSDIPIDDLLAELESNRRSWWTLARSRRPGDREYGPSSKASAHYF
jgi:PIN domain nuclease of toxin-antitoxin system